MKKYKDNDNIFLNRYLMIEERKEEIAVLNILLNDGIIFKLEKDVLYSIFDLVKNGIKRELLIKKLKNILKEEESIDGWLELCIVKGVFE